MKLVLPMVGVTGSMGQMANRGHPYVLINCIKNLCIFQ